MYLINNSTSTKKPKSFNRLNLLFSCCHFSGLATYRQTSSFSQNSFYSSYKINLTHTKSHVSGYYEIFFDAYSTWNTEFSQAEGFSQRAKGIA